jgi:ketosteroid isomerase-like protein
VSEQQNRDTLERYFQVFEQQDLDAMEELLHDDYVEEYPQSGERIRGKDNWRKIAENYPGLPNMTDHSYVLSGDLGVMKMTLEYDGNRVYACEIVDFEDSKIKRARAYFAEPFEAPEWRAQWVERM